VGNNTVITHKQDSTAIDSKTIRKQLRVAVLRHQFDHTPHVSNINPQKYDKINASHKSTACHDSFCQFKYTYARQYDSAYAFLR
jgi:hypothetical protein